MERGSERERERESICVREKEGHFLPKTMNDV